MRPAGIGVGRLEPGLCRVHAAVGRRAQGVFLMRAGAAVIGLAGAAYLALGAHPAREWIAKGIAVLGAFVGLCGAAVVREAKRWAAEPGEGSDDE